MHCSLRDLIKSDGSLMVVLLRLQAKSLAAGIVSGAPWTGSPGHVPFVCTSHAELATLIQRSTVGRSVRVRLLRLRKAGVLRVGDPKRDEVLNGEMSGYDRAGLIDRGPKKRYNAYHMALTPEETEEVFEHASLPAGTVAAAGDGAPDFRQSRTAAADARPSPPEETCATAGSGAPHIRQSRTAAADVPYSSILSIDDEERNKSHHHREPKNGKIPADTAEQIAAAKRDLASIDEPTNLWSRMLAKGAGLCRLAVALAKTEVCVRNPSKYAYSVVDKPGDYGVTLTLAFDEDDPWTGWRPPATTKLGKDIAARERKEAEAREARGKAEAESRRALEWWQQLDDETRRDVTEELAERGCKFNSADFFPSAKRLLERWAAEDRRAAVQDRLADEAQAERDAAEREEEELAEAWGALSPDEQAAMLEEKLRDYPPAYRTRPDVIETVVKHCRRLARQLAGPATQSESRPRLAVVG